MSYDEDTTYLPVYLPSEQVIDILQNGKPGNVIKLPSDFEVGQRLFVREPYTHSEGDYITWDAGGYDDLSDCFLWVAWGFIGKFDDDALDRLEDYRGDKVGLWASRISLLSFGNRRARIERIWRNHQWDRIELPTDVLSKKCINCGQDFPVSRFQGEWNCLFCDYTFSVATDWTNRPPASDEIKDELRADLAQLRQGR